MEEGYHNFFAKFLLVFHRVFLHGFQHEAFVIKKHQHPMIDNRRKSVLMCLSIAVGTVGNMCTIDA
ncbi:MAG: hypothetical protein ACKPKO_07815, partial [Candidatus Fonsibacter sp.]